MRIHYLVEGRSEEVLLKAWLKRALPAHDHRVYPHEGKGHLPADLMAHPDPRRRGLLDQLPAKLRAYGKSHDPALERAMVLVDADREDCRALKRDLIAVLAACEPRPVVCFRIAVEETEAFYLGDVRAIKAAFPNFHRRPFELYEQDSICGTWEVFRDVVGWRHEAKVEWARRMGPHMSTDTRGPNVNQSPSFLAFYRAARALAGEPWP
jgi:hypothetical protein